MSRTNRHYRIKGYDPRRLFRSRLTIQVKLFRPIIDLVSERPSRTVQNFQKCIRCAVVPRWRGYIIVDYRQSEPLGQTGHQLPTPGAKLFDLVHDAMVEKVLTRGNPVAQNLSAQVPSNHANLNRECDGFLVPLWLQRLLVQRFAEPPKMIAEVPKSSGQELRHACDSEFRGEHGDLDCFSVALLLPRVATHHLVNCVPCGANRQQAGQQRLELVKKIKIPIARLSEHRRRKRRGEYHDHHERYHSRFVCFAHHVPHCHHVTPTYKNMASRGSSHGRSGATA